MKPPFYYNNTRKMIITFGTLFNELQIDRVDTNGIFKTIPIPLKYYPKEKFITRINEIDKIEEDNIHIQETLPRMGYELVSIEYDSERKTNTMVQLLNDDKTKSSLNRVPYLFNFSLYIATRKFDDSLRIVEQILPYFTPNLVVTVIDNELLDMESEIDILLNSPAFDVQAGGMMEERRSILWTLDFTVKGYLYSKVSGTTLIKKTIINLRDFDNSSIFETLTSTVNPQNANIDDNYSIIDEIL